MSECQSCTGSDVEQILDLGLQPPSNRFQKSPSEKPHSYPVRVGQCNDCGLIQLTDTIPLNEVKPIYPWITYKEAEEHLPEFVSEMGKLLCGNPSNKRFLGVSFKDASTIGMAVAKGYQGSLLQMADLGLEPNNLESIPSRLVEKVEALIPKYGTFDVVVARHVVEHSGDMKSVLNALSRLVKPEGYLALEVPDFEKSLVNLDYPAIWEEHHAYFTENTFKSFLETNGLEMLYFKNHEYALENSLVSIVRKGKAKDLKQVVASRDLERELYLGRKFGQSFPSIKRKVQSLVSTTKGPVALMGAGHLGTAFINYFEIEDELSVVIDDDKNKRGLFMPGSGLEIKDSSHLDAANTCLLSINPRNLEGFFERHSDYINRGGKFYSIFKNSSAPLPVFYSPEELSLAKSSEEVYYAIKKSGTWELTREHADFLKSNLSKSKTGRIRICTHENPQSPLQEMIILFSGENYVRPHKHTNKSESFHMIEGSLAVLLFDNYGKLDKTVFLDATGKKGDLYYRLESPVYHTVIGLSNNWMIHETTNGPFDSSQTAYAPWAPQAGTNESTTYMKALRLLLEEQRHKA